MEVPKMNLHRPGEFLSALTPDQFRCRNDRPPILADTDIGLDLPSDRETSRSPDGTSAVPRGKFRRWRAIGTDVQQSPAHSDTGDGNRTNLHIISVRHRAGHWVRGIWLWC